MLILNPGGGIIGESPPTSPAMLTREGPAPRCQGNPARVTRNVSRRDPGWASSRRAQDDSGRSIAILIAVHSCARRLLKTERILR
jgi:hypothetical protein